MAVTVTQHKFAHSVANATTVAVTVTSTSAGKLIAVGCRNSGSRTVSSVTDNASGGSNTYVQAASAAATTTTQGAGATDIWYVLSAANAGATTVTITFSGAAGTFAKSAEVWEVSGFTTAAFDVAAVINDTQQTDQIDRGASVTTTSTTGFVVGIATGGLTSGVIISGNPSTTSPYSTFSSGGDIPTTLMGAVSKITSTAAAHQPGWDDGNSFVYLCYSTVAFKESASAFKPDEDYWQRPSVAPIDPIATVWQ